MKGLYRGHVRLQSYVDPELSQRVDRFCAATGLSESTLVKSSLRQYMDGTGDAALVLRRLSKSFGRPIRAREIASIFRSPPESVPAV